jgi:hypothetical protein
MERIPEWLKETVNNATAQVRLAHEAASGELVGHYTIDQKRLDLADAYMRDAQELALNEKQPVDWFTVESSLVWARHFAQSCGAPTY